ncbi:hypothetical protein TNCV_4616331 [Trichonephila clavipes]|nr:hypothetical protein TNCV_4616331 [Trichonephila clavipes]
MPSRAVKLNLSATPFISGVYEFVTSCFIPSSVRNYPYPYYKILVRQVLTAITFYLENVLLVSEIFKRMRHLFRMGKQSPFLNNRQLYSRNIYYRLGFQLALDHRGPYAGRFDLTAPVFLNETLLDFANLHGIQ